MVEFVLWDSICNGNPKLDWVVVVWVTKLNLGNDQCVSDGV